MATVFDIIKLYQSEWTEVNSRNFSPEECKAVQGCSVVASQYGKSVCFLFGNGKRYIPLEPTANVVIGDILDITKLKLVSLQYSGSNPEQQITNIMRIRVENQISTEVSFDNPFGI